MIRFDFLPRRLERGRAGRAKTSFDLRFRLKIKLLPGFDFVTELMEIAIVHNEGGAESGRTRPRAEREGVCPFLHPGEMLCTAALNFHNQENGGLTVVNASKISFL